MKSGDPGLRTVHRAFGLLAVLARTGVEMSLSELARTCSLPVSTVSRLLATLVDIGFVEHARAGRYGPGAHLARIGFQALQKYKAYRLPDSHLAQLVQASGETANLSVRVDDANAMYLRQVPGPRALRHASWAGRFLPLEGTAAGSALLGRLNADGYAVKRHSPEVDFTAIAAPVRDQHGEIVAALSISGPSARISDADLARLGRLVAERARAASRDLGMSAEAPPAAQGN